MSGSALGILKKLNGFLKQFTVKYDISPQALSIFPLDFEFSKVLFIKMIKDVSHPAVLN